MGGSVKPANVQDRDGAVAVVRHAHIALPTIRKTLANEACVGQILDAVQAETSIAVEVTKRNEQTEAFVVVPKRWAVEWTFGWIGRYRRTSKDYERYCETEEYVVKRVMTAVLLRRLRPEPAAMSGRLKMRHAA